MSLLSRPVITFEILQGRSAADERFASDSWLSCRPRFQVTVG